MKKLITFVLLMFVGIGLVGCQNDSKKSEGNPKVKQQRFILLNQILSKNLLIALNLQMKFMLLMILL